MVSHVSLELGRMITLKGPDDLNSLQDVITQYKLRCSSEGDSHYISFPRRADAIKRKKIFKAVVNALLESGFSIRRENRKSREDFEAWFLKFQPEDVSATIQ